MAPTTIIVTPDGHYFFARQLEMLDSARKKGRTWANHPIVKGSWRHAWRSVPAHPRLFGNDPGRAITMSLADVPAAAVLPAELFGNADGSAPMGTIDEQGHRAWRLGCGIATAGEYLFGCATLFVGLAVLATLPVLQLMSLGYLLEAGSRIARTGRITAGLISVRKAARFGGIVLGTWLLLWPLRFVSLLSSSAQLDRAGRPRRKVLDACIVDPDRFVCVACRWRMLARRAVAQLLLAATDPPGSRTARARRLRPGPRCRVEFRPRLAAAVLFLARPARFLGGLAWLIVPISLLAAGSRALALGFSWGATAGRGGALPALCAGTLRGRKSLVGDVRAARGAARPFSPRAGGVLSRLDGHAVVRLPLYLLKVEIIPREAAWLPSLIFVAFIFPARLLTGWAYARRAARGAAALGVSLRGAGWRWRRRRLPMRWSSISRSSPVGTASPACTSSTRFCYRCRSWGCRPRTPPTFSDPSCAGGALQESLHGDYVPHVLAAADQLLLVVGFDGERHATGHRFPAPRHGRSPSRRPAWQPGARTRSRPPLIARRAPDAATAVKGREFHQHQHERRTEHRRSGRIIVADQLGRDDAMACLATVANSQGVLHRAILKKVSAGVARDHPGPAPCEAGLCPREIELCVALVSCGSGRGRNARPRRRLGRFVTSR